MTMKLKNKEIIEISRELTKAVVTVEYNNTDYEIVISNNNWAGLFSVCEYENDDVSDDVITLFENCDFYDEVLDFVRNEQDSYEDKVFSDFEKDLEKNYQVFAEDDCYINDHKEIIYKLQTKDSILSEYVLKIEHVSDSTKNEFFTIEFDDFESSNFIQIEEWFDFDSNKIDIENYF